MQPSTRLRVPVLLAALNACFGPLASALNLYCRKIGVIASEIPDLVPVNVVVLSPLFEEGGAQFATARSKVAVPARMIPTHSISIPD